MARGPKKHLKRLCAPKSWLMDKTGGVFAPRPRTGPHKMRESLPVVLILRNRLRYALNYEEARKITMQRFVKVDHRVRTDPNFPTGIMDVVQIEKVGENFRILYDVKGRFLCHRITAEEANFKLCKVVKKFMGPKGVPIVITSDARTIRYPDPLIRINDTVVFDLRENKIKDFMSLEPGNLSMVTGGRNLGRIGVIVARDHHAGGFDIVRIKDTVGNVFATRLSNVFVIGKGTKAYISLPKGKGVKLTVAEERDKRLAKKAKQVTKAKELAKEKLTGVKAKPKKSQAKSKASSKVAGKGKGKSTAALKAKAAKGKTGPKGKTAPKGKAGLKAKTQAAGKATAPKTKAAAPAKPKTAAPAKAKTAAPAKPKAAAPAAKPKTAAPATKPKAAAPAKPKAAAPAAKPAAPKAKTAAPAAKPAAPKAKTAAAPKPKAGGASAPKPKPKTATKAKK